MKRTRLKPPYNDEGRTNFPARHVPGCYLIYRDGAWDRQLRYVGMSASDVYKALYRHFQVWNDKAAEAGLRGERIVYKVRSKIQGPCDLLQHGRPSSRAGESAHPEVPTKRQPG